MNELKPEYIIRALEYHADYKTDNCFECPYENYLSKADGNCVHRLSTDALALLREKDALLEEWDAKCNDYETQLMGKDAEIERLTKDFLDYQADVKMEIAGARAEAITEFEDRLKTFYSHLNGKTVGGSVEYHIEQIAKEMRGEI